MTKLYLCDRHVIILEHVSLMRDFQAMTILPRWVTSLWIASQVAGFHKDQLFNENWWDRFYKPNIQLV